MGTPANSIGTASHFFARLGEYTELIPPHFLHNQAKLLLHRVIYASEAVGATGTSTLSVAQILGIAERNNRRDHITSCLVFHGGKILHVIEGARVDVDRLLRRVRLDPRHRNLNIILDRPIPVRAIEEAVVLCDDPIGMLAKAGVSTLSDLTANGATSLLESRAAA